MRYYLDTCVWIAYLDRGDRKHGKAARIFEKIGKTNGLIVVSSCHDYELKGTVWHKKYLALRNDLSAQEKCISVKLHYDDGNTAFKLDESIKVGYGDLLHILTAKRCGAKMISFDRHWEEAAKRLGISVRDGL